jgi:hypothetical protein
MVEIMLLKAKPSHEKVSEAQRLFEFSKQLLGEIRVERTCLVGSFILNCARDDCYEIDVIGICPEG